MGNLFICVYLDSRYVKTRRLGEGTFAVVYEAMDTSCDPPKRVALKKIKLIKQEGITPNGLKMGRKKLNVITCMERYMVNTRSGIFTVNWKSNVCSNMEKCMVGVKDGIYTLNVIITIMICTVNTLSIMKKKYTSNA